MKGINYVYSFTEEKLAIHIDLKYFSEKYIFTFLRCSNTTKGICYIVDDKANKTGVQISYANHSQAIAELIRDIETKSARRIWCEMLKYFG